ncbi:hypothetical protein F5141DRAFT_1089224 [Pisolithus sp. B1]|nr:hypothetical protein F5141DRAFT_1089224 [Pisolithus sp. B1]
MAPRSSQSRTTQGGLSRIHLLELRAIWKEDQRVPSVASRRAWAISRNANPTLVNSWFHRRRAAAKRAGEPITLESYELSLESRLNHGPPVLTGLELPFSVSSDDEKLGLDNDFSEHIETLGMFVDESDDLLHVLSGEPSEKGPYMRSASSPMTFDYGSQPSLRFTRYLTFKTAYSFQFQPSRCFPGLL